VLLMFGTQCIFRSFSDFDLAGNLLGISVGVVVLTLIESYVLSFRCTTVRGFDIEILHDFRTTPLP